MKRLGTVVTIAFLSAFAQPAFAQGVLSEAAKDVDAAANKVGEKVKTATYDAFDKKTEVVDFSKGSSTVSSGELSSLRALVNSLDMQSKEQKVYVAAWADQSPSGTTPSKTLGNDSVKLANERLSKVEQALKGLNVRGEVVQVNLAKNPNTLQELFGTKAAKVTNKTLNNENSDDALLNDAGKVIQGKGGPSKVVIYIQQ
ncbi:MAG: hypothetical protein IOD12_00590 [Silvanigrellales bacterium]|jgi:hypothetical protein|nr:hypothetical protein [Silvanigrellales bacterium]